MKLLTVCNIRNSSTGLENENKSHNITRKTFFIGYVTLGKTTDHVIKIKHCGFFSLIENMMGFVQMRGSKRVSSDHGRYRKWVFVALGPDEVCVKLFGGVD
ncbi:hypothetical protein SCA6_004532 [Theobroma cacao]